MLSLLTSVLSRISSVGGEGSKSNPPPPKLELDYALLEKTIKESLKTFEEFEKQRDRDLVLIMRHEAGNMSGEMAMATPPLNGGKRNAEKNISEDVNMIFKPLEDIPFAELVLAKEWPAVTAYNFKFESKALAKAYDAGNWDVITKAFQNGGMGGEFSPYNGPDINVISNPNTKFHKMGRGQNGKLNKKRFHVTGSKDSAQGKIDDYAAAAAAAIGSMAGGWVKCYLQLNGTGYSLPIDYAKKGKGYTRTKWWGENKEITIQNDLGNFGGFIDQRSSKFKGIVDSAMERVQKRHVQNSNKLLKSLNMQ